jgi:hypothetical protein
MLENPLCLLLQFEKLRSLSRNSFTPFTCALIPWITHANYYFCEALLYIKSYLPFFGKSYEQCCRSGSVSALVFVDSDLDPAALEGIINQEKFLEVLDVPFFV